MTKLYFSKEDFEKTIILRGSIHDEEDAQDDNPVDTDESETEDTNYDDVADENITDEE